MRPLAAPVSYRCPFSCAVRVGVQPLDCCDSRLSAGRKNRNYADAGAGHSTVPVMPELNHSARRRKLPSLSKSHVRWEYRVLAIVYLAWLKFRPLPVAEIVKLRMNDRQISKLSRVRLPLNPSREKFNEKIAMLRLRSTCWRCWQGSRRATSTWNSWWPNWHHALKHCRVVLNDFDNLARNPQRNCDCRSDM